MNPMTDRPLGTRGKRGFTLMELMVVIAILGLLVTMVAPNVWNVFKKGNITTARAQMQEITGAISQYRMNNNKIPEQLEDLAQPDPNNFNDSYMEEIPLDPWGNPYEYKKLSSSKFEIISLGADGMPGGEGEDEDLNSTQKAKK